VNDDFLYFLDTNAASEFMRGRDKRLVEQVERHMSQLRLSSIVWTELRYGAYKRPDMPVFQERLVRLRERIVEVEVFDERAADAAAQLQAYLEMLKPNAQPIGERDYLIAGHALSRGAGVVTNNVEEFGRVPGLVVVDWETME